MLVILRFRVPTSRRGGFDTALEGLVAHLRGCEGLVDLQVGRAVDDDELVAVVTRWATPKAWRRAYGTAAGRMAFLPVVADLLDEPSAYVGPDDDHENVPRTTRG